MIYKEKYTLVLSQNKDFAFNRYLLKEHIEKLTKNLNINIELIKHETKNNKSKNKM